MKRKQKRKKKTINKKNPNVLLRLPLALYEMFLTVLLTSPHKVLVKFTVAEI